MRVQIKGMLCGIAALLSLGTAGEVFADVDAYTKVQENHVCVFVEGAWEKAAHQPVGFLFTKQSAKQGEAVWADQQIASEDGRVSFQFIMNSKAGSSDFGYTLTAPEAGQIAGVIEVVDFQLLKQVWERVSAANAEAEVEAAMLEFNPCLNLPVYEEIDLQEWYEYLFQEKEQVRDPQSFYDCMRQGAVLAGLNQGAKSAMSDGKLANLELLGVDQRILDIYDTELSTQGRSNVNSRMLYVGFASIERCTDDFEKLVLTNRITHGIHNEPQQVLEWLKSDGVKLGMNLSQLNATSTPLEICRKLVRKGAQTPEQLEEDYNSICTELNHIDGGSTGTGSSGRGGGIGGGGSYSPAPAQQISESPSGGSAKPLSGFTDMSGFEWAEEAIYSLKKKGCISGTSETTFEPAQTVTREEFVKLIMGMLSGGEQALETEAEGEQQAGEVQQYSGFSDVTADMWCTPYIRAATRLGIIKGVEADRFGVGVPVSRQDMAAIAFRALRYCYDAFPAAGQEPNFTDQSQIAEYALSAVRYLKRLEVISGYPDGSFRPEGTANRAEAAQIVYRMMTVVQNV